MRLRADAERTALAAGIKDHPWTGAQQRLEKAITENAAHAEQQAAKAFADAFTRYRDLLEKKQTLEDTAGRAEAERQQSSDGQAYLQRYNAFRSSALGKDWMFERRERRPVAERSALDEGDVCVSDFPPGFTAEQFARMETFTRADAALAQAAVDLHAVTVQMNAILEAHPVFSDLRATEREPSHV